MVLWKAKNIQVLEWCIYQLTVNNGYLSSVNLLVHFLCQSILVQPSVCDENIVKVWGSHHPCFHPPTKPWYLLSSNPASPACLHCSEWRALFALQNKYFGIEDRPPPGNVYIICCMIWLSYWKHARSSVFTCGLY